MENGAEEGLFSVSGMIETARSEAGVEDASVLDSPGLRALSHALTSTSDELNFIGRRRAQRLLIETLIKRLRVENYLNNDPAIGNIRLQSPIFLVAPFRTGTTLLHRLLAQDPAHRTLRLWEALQAPPPKSDFQGDPRYFECDYRVAIARRYIETRERYTPDIASIHPTDVDAPEECFGLLETSLLSHSFTFYGPVTEYLDWLGTRNNNDWKAAYALYADQLRLLQWWAPADRWVLKTPFHMWAVDALCATFPDALIVQQHRDPATCVASYC
ncbi:MAG: sulfotransferase, partial [Gammaproteobacteria bacterium]